MSGAIFVVTGATDHLGSFVVQELLSKGKQVRDLVLPGESCPGINNR